MGNTKKPSKSGRTDPDGISKDKPDGDGKPGRLPKK